MQVLMADILKKILPLPLASKVGAAGSGEGGGGGSAEGSVSGDVGGLGGVRHRAAVAEARRRLGGGGKRGWLG